MTRRDRFDEVAGDEEGGKAMKRRDAEDEERAARVDRAPRDREERKKIEKSRSYPLLPLRSLLRRRARGV